MVQEPLQHITFHPDKIFSSLLHLQILAERKKKITYFYLFIFILIIIKRSEAKDVTEGNFKCKE